MQDRLVTSVQKCVKCRQHRIIVPYKNHRNVCPYINCECFKCIMVDNYRTRYHRNKRAASAESSESSGGQDLQLSNSSTMQNPLDSINFRLQSEPVDVSRFQIFKIDPIPLRSFNINPDFVQNSPLQEALLQALLAQCSAYSKVTFSTPAKSFLEAHHTAATVPINNITYYGVE